ncbi:MAG: hypothetical protein WCK42_04495 [Myxococcaceae bacterium]
MKFLIAFMVSVNLFSADFNEVKASIEEIQTRFQKGPVSEREADILKNKILDILRAFEINYWDEELESFFENTLNYLADLSLREGVAYSSDTLVQMMRVLEGYLEFMITPNPPNILNKLMDRILDVAMSLEQPGKIAALTGLFKKHNRLDLLKILLNTQSQKILNQLRSQSEQTLPSLTQMTEQIIQMQAEIELNTDLFYRIQNTIMGIMTAAEPLAIEARELLVQMIQERLRFVFWFQLNIIWKRFTAPSDEDCLRVAENVRMMR